MNVNNAPVPGLPGLNMPTKKTIGAEKAADSILECLSVGAEYERQVAEARGQPVQPPLLMAAYNCNSAEDFLLEILKKIRSSELEEALLLLPFSAACEALRRAGALLERGASAELVSRAALFLLRLHRAPLCANPRLLKHLIQIQAKAAIRINELRDMMGYNLHALQWLRRETEAAESEQLFKVAVGEKKARDSKRRARQAVKRPIITVT